MGVPWPRKNQFGLGMAFFGAHGIGTHVVGPLPVFGHMEWPFFAQKNDDLGLKARFSLEILESF